ncbi:hypothetical protein OBBRIDRAFT_803304 [Obba rivulosa]|uniref:F-box domain-containing protein n=1 Tax=Obba rivulosa TaxID=1052685 RepID=A0A8E2DLW6_9APHY|nr:hypothetical protein OBBRIDRAFT_803304 [Obba rivulosa]
MFFIPRLNEDCAHIILSYMNKASLLKMARTSRATHVATRTYLSRTVNLDRSDEQVLAFCDYILNNDLANHIRHLRIGESAYFVAGWGPLHGAYHSDEGAEDRDHRLFVRHFADVLEQARNLILLVITPLAQQLLDEPRILQAIISRPPAAQLELAYLEQDTLTTLSRLRMLSPVRLSPGVEIVAFPQILANNADGLRELDLRYCFPDYPYPSSQKTLPQFPCIRALSLVSVPTTLQQLAAVFPNLRDLVIGGTTEGYDIPNFEQSCVETMTTLWPELRSLEGEASVVMGLAATSPQLRRIDVQSTMSDASFNELCTTMQLRSIASFRLLVTVRPSPSIVENLGAWSDRGVTAGTFWSKIADAFPQATYMNLTLQYAMPMNESTIISRLVKDPSVRALGALRPLKYVTFLIATWFDDEDDHDGVRYCSQTASPGVQSLVRHWFNEIPSLDYLELRSIYAGAGSCQWRRQLDLTQKTQFESGDVLFQSVLVTDEECLDISEQYEWEGCR